MNALVDWLLTTVQSVDPGWRVLIASVAMFCETSILLGLIVPGDTIVLISGTGVQTWWQGAALVSGIVVGSLAGESLGFALGHHFGPAIRASRLGRRIGERNWERAETYIARRGGIAILLSRFLPVLHSLVPVTVGTSPMRYRRFLLWTAPACVLWAIAYVSVGALAAGSYRDLSAQLTSAGWIFFAVVVVFVGVAFLIRRQLHRREQRHMQQEPPV